MLTNIVFANMFGKVIFPRTSGKPGENDEPTVSDVNVKIIGEIGKSSHEHGREQKFRQTWYPLSCQHPLCLSKKATRDGSQGTVGEPRINYTYTVGLRTKC